MNKSHQSCGINGLCNEGVTQRIGGAIVKGDNKQRAAWSGGGVTWKWTFITELRNAFLLPRDGLPLVCFPWKYLCTPFSLFETLLSIVPLCDRGTGREMAFSWPRWVGSPQQERTLATSWRLSLSAAQKDDCQRQRARNLTDSLPQCMNRPPPLAKRHIVKPLYQPLVLWTACDSFDPGQQQKRMEIKPRSGIHSPRGPISFSPCNEPKESPWLSIYHGDRLVIISGSEETKGLVFVLWKCNNILGVAEKWTNHHSK